MSNKPSKEDPRGGGKRAQRVGRLHTVGHIVSEMGKLYRQARRGEITSSDAARLASILALMRQGLEASDLERRLNDLEAGDAPDPAPKPMPLAWTPSERV